MGPGSGLVGPRKWDGPRQRVGGARQRVGRLEQAAVAAAQHSHAGCPAVVAHAMPMEARQNLCLAAGTGLVSESATMASVDT